MLPQKQRGASVTRPVGLACLQVVRWVWLVCSAFASLPKHGMFAPRLHRDVRQHVSISFEATGSFAFNSSLARPICAPCCGWFESSSSSLWRLCKLLQTFAMTNDVPGARNVSGGRHATSMIVPPLDLRLASALSHGEYSQLRASRVVLLLPSSFHPRNHYVMSFPVPKIHLFTLPIRNAALALRSFSSSRLAFRTSLQMYCNIP